MKTRAGRPYPLGATWDGLGVNFALFSENATGVDLCFFDSPKADRESHRLAVKEHTDKVWHIYVAGLEPGQLYGYRVHGPYEPSKGHRFNANKIVLDPYAKAVGRQLRWSAGMFGYTIGEKKDDLSFDERDNAPWAPLAAVIDTAFSWGEDRSPHTPWDKTVIYELHVKGFTQRHPQIPAASRGTYSALAMEPAIDHLKSLGVTAVELMPVHFFTTDWSLEQKGLTNYWGYNTLGFFAPELRYAASRQPEDTVREFKRMVRALHKNDIEIVLDVVYNHTAEGNHMGPTLSLKGIDNAAYYRLMPNDPRFYMDYTGCGNTLDMRHPKVLQLIMDSLRYWVTEMHVDGFRFDLASALARELHEVDKLGAFFDIIHQDPVLSQVKLIAEPWDLGQGGYQVGNFPIGWTEWNGKYRDDVRRFWKGDGGMLSEFATRLCGSSDLYEHSGRRPYASINFITCHDGFTLHDLVSYNEKHNDANLEDNQDGTNDNASWNGGAEGPTDDPAVNALRERQKRNFLATLLFSQGVPMISMGDEMGRTQRGNNNAYCQDNELSWQSWDLTAPQQALLTFTRAIAKLRQSEPALRSDKFFQGRPLRGSNIKDVSFFNPDGGEMTDQDWQTGHARCLGIRWAPNLERLEEAERDAPAHTLLLLLNAYHEPIAFQPPKLPAGQAWEVIVDTWDEEVAPRPLRARVRYALKARSLALFRNVKIA